MVKQCAEVRFGDFDGPETSGPPNARTPITLIGCSVVTRCAVGLNVASSDSTRPATVGGDASASAGDDLVCEYGDS